MKVGIVGNGFVGKATYLLKCPSIEMLVYDIRAEACDPPGTKLEDLEQCDVVFLCLPTPMNHDGSCYTKILEDTIKLIKNPYKVIRSTVPSGFSQSQGCFFMPEFLTEVNWKIDFQTQSHWVFGLLQEESEVINEQFKKRIQKVFKTSQIQGSIQSSSIFYMKNSEAEMLKYIKNCFLAAKVGIFNEFYDFCENKNLDYQDLKQLLLLDPRIGQTHMNVPGYNFKRGFGGTCFPKDTLSLYNQYQGNNVSSIIFQSVLDRNENVDRIEREWKNDVWRTTIPATKPISLVTGGAGFLGSNLCGRLLALGHIVICLDNDYCGKMENLQEFRENPDFLIKKADVTNKMFFPKIDNIWHLACPASPPKYQADGYKTLLTSTQGTINTLELALTHKSQFLYTSTSEIYGDPLEHPQKETYWGNVNTVGPRSCYDEGKRCAESLIYEFRKKHPEMLEKLKIVRIFNTYGPKMDIDDGRVITNFLKAAIMQQPIPIYGDGSQSRSFCYVDDMIDGFVAMMNSKEQGPINLGNPFHEFTMIQLKDIVQEIVGSKLQIENHPLPVNDPKKRKPDITLAKEKLQWEPKIDIKEGIKLTFQYTQQILSKQKK